MKLPTITPKQTEILTLLYTYRFIDRIQLQAFLRHKDKRRVLSWLKDLREKHYIEWIYSTDFTEKSKPAIYYVGINGVRLLKRLDAYPLAEVQKRYKEGIRSRAFIDRSILIANCCLALRTEDWSVIPEADYIDPDHEYHFLAEHEVLRPNLCIMRYDEQDIVTAHYLLEIFDATLPRYRMRRRLKAYVSFLDDDDWEGADPQPIILLVCPTITDLIYAKRATKKLIEDTYAKAGTLRIWFTTTEKLRHEGITAQLWEEGRGRYGL